MSIIRPRITVLNPEQIVQTHNYSLNILSSVGVRVDSERARRVFIQAGCRENDNGRVRIPPEIVEWALSVAPSGLEIFDRRGNPAFCLDQSQNNQTIFGIGVTNLYYQDPETDAVTPFARKHMEISTRLGNKLSGFDVISTIGIIRDVPQELSDFYETLEMVANTTKPLVILVSEEQNFMAVLHLLQHLHGDLAERSFIIPYFNPVTPLTVNKGTAENIFVAIEHGLPFIYSNYGMAGATTPITPAGTLVVLNAELLAGLVLSQSIKKGTPVILGSLPASFDMQVMMSYYGPQTFLLNLACAEMMAYYHIPHCGTSGSGSGWGPDLLAGETLWMNHLTSCIGKVKLAPFVGGNFDSMAFSPTTVVYADQMIRQARCFAQGFTLDDESIALDEIGTEAAAGNFLTANLTLKLIRETDFSNPIFPRLSLEQWQARDCPRAEGLLRHYTQQLLDELKAPEDHKELITRGEEFIRNYVRSRSL